MNVRRPASSIGAITAVNARLFRGSRRAAESSTLRLELYELSRGITALRLFTFAINLGIVGGTAHVLADTRRRR